jgi:hypothetical protein
MARRREPAQLKVRVSFETTRTSEQCLAQAYDRLVPISRRRLRPATRPAPV